MRIYKYIFFGMLFLMCAFSCSGQFLDYVALDSGDRPYIQFQFDKSNSKSAIEEIIKLKEKYDVGVYIPDIYNEDRSIVRCSYYADDASKKALESDRYIRNGSYRGGLSGRYIYRIEFYSLEEAIEKISYIRSITLVGNEKNVQSFADEFMSFTRNTYGEQALCEAYFPDEPSVYGVCRYILYQWLVAVGILLVITVFEVTVIRKEAIVSLMGGSSIGAFIAKRLIGDLVAYSAIMSALFLLLYIIGTPVVCYLSCLAAMGAVMTGTVVIYLTLYLSNIKKALAGVKQGTKVLYFNYFVKLIALCASLAFLIDIIRLLDNNSVNYNTEETIGKYFSSYSYTNVVNGVRNSNRLNKENVKEIVYDIYKKHYYDLKPLRLAGNESPDGNTHYVSANAYALEYLVTVVPELKDIHPSSSLILAGRKGDKNFEDHIKRIVDARKELAASDPQRLDNNPEPYIVYYENSTEILCIDADTNTQTQYFHDPIISISTAEPDELDKRGAVEDYNALLLDKDKIQMLCREYDMREQDMEICSVKDTFQRQWGVGKAAIASQITLEAVMLFVVMLISFSILKFTFITKAKELCIKRIFGHGFLSRYYPTFLLSISVYIPGLIYALDRDKKASFGANTGLITAFTLGVMVVDLLVSMPYIFKTEKANVSKVLKGGAL